MPFIPIADVKAEALKSRTAELSCASLGGHVLSFSDEWFAEATNLIKPGPAESLEGQFGPNGALYDGWETRRHNPTYDWVILRLGPNGGSYIAGFDVDTSTFNGNEAPTVEIYGANTEDASLASDDQRVRSCKLIQSGSYFFPKPLADLLPIIGLSRTTAKSHRRATLTSSCI